MANLITYKIQEDIQGKLKTAAKAACNVWNSCIEPATPIVVRIGHYTSRSGSVAKAWTPWENNGVLYGRVEFNRLKLRRYSDRQIITSLMHEMGHILGFGFGQWKSLYHRRTGRFLPAAIARVPELEQMRVELDFGRGTKYSHWDEAEFDGELMTGFKDNVEHLLPVTLQVLTLFGHRLIRPLQGKTPLDELLDQFGDTPFTRHEDVAPLDVDHLEETTVEEEISEPELDAPPATPAITPAPTAELPEVPAAFTDTPLADSDILQLQGSLALIVGHTRARPGAIGTAPLTQYEYTYNLEIAELAKTFALEHGLHCEIFTRDQLGVAGTYEQAAAWEPHAICELHFNAANRKARGTEVLYASQRDLPGIYEKALAQTMQNEICAVFQRQGKHDRGIKERVGGPGERGFTNLSQTFTIASVLLEPFFGDNPEDAQLAVSLKADYAAAIVRAFAKWKKHCDDLRAEAD